MKVSELIVLLSQYEGDLVVVVDASEMGYNDVVEVEGLELKEDGAGGLCGRYWTVCSGEVGFRAVRVGGW